MATTMTVTPPDPTDFVCEPDLDQLTAALHGPEGRSTLGRWTIASGCIPGRRGYRYVAISDAHTLITHTGPFQSTTSPRPLTKGPVDLDDATAIKELWETACRVMDSPRCATCGGLGQTVSYCGCSHGCSSCEGFNPDRQPCPTCCADAR